MWLAAIAIAAAPPFEDLFAKDARVEKVAGGFAFVEGPASREWRRQFFFDVPRGEFLGIIETPPADCAFGGADVAIPYIAARTSHNRVKLARSRARPERRSP